METAKLFIPNISCSHCTGAIEKELSGVEGIIEVQGDPEIKSIIIKWNLPSTLEKIKAVLKEINYPAAE